MEKCVCANCDWQGDDSQVNPIQDIMQRIDPGGTVPAGECPKCGALCYLDAPDDTVSITWSVDDVLTECPRLTRQDARRVLLTVVADHDATIGVNWDVIRAAAQRLFPQHAQRDGSHDGENRDQ